MELSRRTVCTSSAITPACRRSIQLSIVCCFTSSARAVWMLKIPCCSAALPVDAARGPLGEPPQLVRRDAQMLWVDPETETFVILLTSRLHPDGRAPSPSSSRMMNDRSSLIFSTG